LSGGAPGLHVPPSGLVEIADARDTAGDSGVFEPRPDRVHNSHPRELLSLGFVNAPAAEGVAERPVGRFEGETWFDVGGTRSVTSREGMNELCVGFVRFPARMSR
jgi:hypothetical protein